MASERPDRHMRVTDRPFLRGALDQKPVMSLPCVSCLSCLYHVYLVAPVVSLVAAKKLAESEQPDSPDIYVVSN